jgi:photosystem II stability/assembly factor-like uncharacterized protein
LVFQAYASYILSRNVPVRLAYLEYVVSSLNKTCYNILPSPNWRLAMSNLIRILRVLVALFPILRLESIHPAFAESPPISVEPDHVSVMTGLPPATDSMRSRFSASVVKSSGGDKISDVSNQLGLVKQFEETSYFLNDTEFITSSLGWAVGLPYWDQPAGVYTATIIRTTDGGDTWTAQTTGLAENLNAIDMLDANQGWAVGTEGTILQTADGGLHWNRQAVATSDEFRGVAFADAQNGWATSVLIHHYDQFGEPDDWRASLWHTTNGGITWQIQTLPPDAAILNRIDFVDALHGWTVGVKYIGNDSLGHPDHRAVIYHTENGGTTWSEQSYAAESVRITFTGVDFIDTLHGWVVGFHHVFAASEGVIFHTEDGGATWERQAPRDNLMDVQFLDAQRGYAAGFDYIGAQGPPVYRTQDGGDTWEKVLMKHDDMEGVYGIAVLESRVFALGDHDFQAISNGPWGVYQPPWGENLFTQGYINIHYTFEDVFFANAQQGWAVGSRSYLPAIWGQVIFHTTDGGETWEKQYEQAPLLNQTFSYFRLDSVFFLDDQTGWAVGMSTYDQTYHNRWAILYTDNGGLTWQEQGQNLHQGLAPEFFDVQFLDAQNGWALDTGHYDSLAEETRLFLARTQDGGLNWNWVNTGLPGNLNIGFALVQGGLDFTDADHGWAAGGLGEVIHTADGGSTWITQTLTCDWPVCDKRLFDIDFIDNQVGWIAGEGLYHTADGGDHWDMHTLAYKIDFHDVQFLDLVHGWLAGDKGIALYTTNGGADWQLARNADTLANLRGMYLLDPQTGWFVGEMGTIFTITELPIESLYLPLVIH